MKLPRRTRLAIESRPSITKSRHLLVPESNDVPQVPPDEQRADAASDREHALATLANCSPDFIGLIDHNGYFEYINAAGKQLLGIADDDRVRESAFLDVVHESDRERFRREVLEQGIAAGKWVGETVLQHLQTGAPIPMELMVFAINYSHDGKLRYGVIARDRRENKKIEATLIQSEKLAAMGRLAGVIAHEINNPLQSVIELVYLLQHSSPLQSDPETQKRFQILEEELFRLAHIARATLSFCRESGKPVGVDLTAIVEEVLQICRRELNLRHIEVIKSYRTREMMLNLPGEMRQVFLNLISNAIDAMPSGGRLRILLRRSREWANPRRSGVRVSICDTGSGVTGEAATRIFEPFFTTKEVKGTGLGLWITRIILQRHEGTIRFRSLHWNGHMVTCFSVFLPTESVAKPKLSFAGELAKLKNSAIQRDLSRASLEFLMAETELGNTFAAKALTSADENTIKRNREQARRAYDEVRRHRTRVELSAAELDLLNARMRDLKAKLEKLQMRPED